MKNIAIFFLTLFIPTLVFAHPGNTDSKGGHTCRTNCPKWGLSYGQYHLHVPKKAVPVPVVKPVTTVKPPVVSKQKVYVKGYYKKDGTYVKGYWRNK